MFLVGLQWLHGDSGFQPGQEDLYYFFTNHEREDDFFPCLVGGGTTFLVQLKWQPATGLGCHLPESESDRGPMKRPPFCWDTIRIFHPFSDTWETSTCGVVSAFSIVPGIADQSNPIGMSSCLEHDPWSMWTTYDGGLTGLSMGMINGATGWSIPGF